MTPQRVAQLVAFLKSLGLDPAAPDGPGATAAALAPIAEALNHSSLGESLTHDHLEFLGDAVLRLAATEFLRRRHGHLKVGEQSALRGQLVSDSWLAALGEGCGLWPLLRIGPMASGDGAGRATVLAECTEALLGAVYIAWGGPDGGLEPVIRWLSPHWLETAQKVLADPHRQNWKSALQEWSQSQGLGLPLYSCQEASLSHGDPKRFQSFVKLERNAELLPTHSWRVPLGEGWGRSRRAAEQEAARSALRWLEEQGLIKNRKRENQPVA